MSTATSYRPITGPSPDTPEWLEERYSHIGASEAAAACGLSRWRTPLDVYLEKRRLVEPREETVAMRLGKALEPVIRREYELRTEIPLIAPLPMYWHPDTPHIAASLDAMADADPHFPVELKASTFRRAHEFGEEGTDEIPDDYLCQCQQQMYVTGSDRCDLAVLLDGRTLRRYTIHRHEALIDRMVAVETELWERIVAGDPPAPDFSHPRTPELVKAMFGVEAGESLVIDADIMAVWDDYRALGETAKEIDAKREEAKARVLYAIGSAAIGLLPDGRQLARSVVNRKEYVCKACSFVQIRERKAK